MRNWPPMVVVSFSRNIACPRNLMGYRSRLSTGVAYPEEAGRRSNQGPADVESVGAE